jgi:hypothetical protein
MNLGLEASIPTFIISLLAFLLNLLLIYLLILRVKLPKGSPKALIVVITLIDLAWSIQQLVYMSIIFFKGVKVMRSTEQLCQINAFTIGITFRCSIWSVATLSMIKLLNGCLKYVIPNIFWYITVILHICLNFSLGFYSILYTAAKQSTSGVQCISFTTNDPMVKGLYLFQVCYLCVGSIIIVISYFGLTVYLLISVKKFIFNSTLKPNSSYFKKLYKRQKIIIISNFIIIVIVYIMGFYPTLISFLLKPNNLAVRRNWEDIIIIVFSQLICLFNPILTIYSDKDIKLQFCKVFKFGNNNDKE